MRDVAPDVRLTETKSSKIHVGGQLQRDKLGYAVELVFRPPTKQPR